jgi:predicted dehydrogenase
VQRKLKIGVIGVGHLGRAHVRILSKLERVEFVGCFDVLPAKSQASANEFGVRAFDDAQKLIAECEAISLVVPTSEHHRCAAPILSAGKHLFVEKPIASNVVQAQDLISMAARAGVSLMVGHIERFNPAVTLLRSRITRPTFIEAHRLSQFNFRGLDVAVIHDLMIHDIDLCLHLVGSEITDIQASAAAVVSERMDIANARLTFASGCVANLTASRISPKPMRKLRIFQPKGYISMDLGDQTAEIYRLLDREDAQQDTAGFSTSVDYGDTGKKIVFTKPDIDRYDMLTAELSSFVDSVLDNKPVAVTGDEAMRALRVAMDIERIALAGLERLQHHPARGSSHE